MATLTSGTGGNVSFNTFDLDFLFYYDAVPIQSASQLRLQFNLGNGAFEYIDFFGSGFTWDNFGNPIGGTINRVTATVTGAILIGYETTDWIVEETQYGAGFGGMRWDVTGLSVPVTTFVSWANSNAISTALNTMFAGNDSITGSDRVFTTSDGSIGDDLFGYGGNDQLTGLAGADFLDGGSGADTMAGGADSDTYVVDNVGDVIVENAGEGSDTVSSSVDCRLSANLEALTLTGTALAGWGNSAANTVAGNASGNYLFGGEGNDVLNGLAGGDIIYGEGGDDTLAGGEDGDELFGNWGHDTLDGGGGADWLLGDNPGENVTVGNDTLRGGAGYDRLLGQAGDDRLEGGEDIDELFGGPGTDQLYGQAGSDWLLGEDGADQLFGDVGYDRLYGGAGNDTLDGGVGLVGDTLDEIFGEDGNDLLLGAEGSDWLIGGAGADTLTGGAGADNFVYSGAGSGVDHVTDYAYAQFDVIRSNGAAWSIFVSGANTVIYFGNFGGIEDAIVLDNYTDTAHVWVA